MAESQEFALPDQATVDAMESILSLPRFAAYNGHADRDHALRLYLWNARLAKAFLFPLQVCEVSTRNAANDGLASMYGPNWILNPPFGLNDFSKASHERALDRLARKSALTGSPGPNADDLIAALTFDFWSNLFREDYEHIWTPPVLDLAFPNLAPGNGRRSVQRLAREVNTLRNRIAHHEPIHDRQDHGKKLSTILDLIGLRCCAAREFTRQHSTVMAVARVPPSPQARFPGRPLAQLNLRPPPLLTPDTALDHALCAMQAARPELALVTVDNGPRFTAISTETATSLIVQKAASMGGLVDLSELTAGEVSVTRPMLLADIDVRASTGDALALFNPPGKNPLRPAAILVWAADGTLVGALVRPDVRL